MRRYELGAHAPSWIMGKIAAVLVKNDNWQDLWERTKGPVNPSRSILRSPSMRVDPKKFAEICQIQGLPVIYDSELDRAFYIVDEETAVWETLKSSY